MMNIPLLFYANQTIYQDLIYPTINEVSLSQIEEADDIQLKLNIKADDNNEISRVRLIFKQDSSWRAQSIHVSDKTTINTMISGLENIDSIVRYFVEVQDKYGNIVGSNISELKIHSTIIPYLKIGLGIILAIGVASTAALIYNKMVGQASYNL